MKKPLICGIALLATMVAVGCALAQTPDLTKRTEKGFYLEPGLGINWMDQQSGHPQPADAGVHLSIVGGYRIHRLWAVELHTGYLRNVLPRTATRPEATLSQVPFIGSLVLHIPTSGRIEPYLGAGLGVISQNAEDDSGGDVAAEYILGARYMLDERKEIGLSYRFIMLGATSAFADETLGNDSLMVALKMRL